MRQTIAMAVAAQQVRIAVAEDGMVAVKKEVIADPETGMLLEVEKVIVAVDAGDGRIAVREQQRIVGVQVVN